MFKVSDKKDLKYTIKIKLCNAKREENWQSHIHSIGSVATGIQALKMEEKPCLLWHVAHNNNNNNHNYKVK